jgi:hypothetical protein
MLAFRGSGTAVILMSNISNGDSIFMELLRTLIGDRFTPAKWEGYTQTQPSPELRKAH